MSKIVRTWLPKLTANVFAKIIIWPEREALRENLPTCFSSFKECVCITDCTEIYIECPLNLNARGQIFSNYKLVSFLSAGWGGRASESQLTHGDCVLADRGFLVEEELTTRGAVLRIPAFTRGKKQMTAKDINISRKIAC